MESFYFFIGTKAQAIKSIPLMSKIQEDSNFDVILVDSGQHFLITEKIFDSYNFKTLKLHSSNRNISTYIGGLSWVFKFIFRNILFKNKKLFVDRSNRGTCVVHGDTMSTLLGMLWAKRNNLKVLHLESGLTSSDIFNPFPEEIIRRIVSKYSDILICFDDKSHELLIDKYSKTKKVIKRISTNTIVDTISQENTLVDKNLITVTMHRNENLLSRKRVKRLIELLSKINNSYKINWYLHEPTENMLKKRKPSIPKNVKLLPDGACNFTRGVGMSCHWDSERGFGERSWRYSALVVDGIVKKVFIEQPMIQNSEADPFEVSNAETMFSFLQNIREVPLVYFSHQFSNIRLSYIYP